ncbi:C25 family cysteine peptidase, partial [Acidobacteriota bacterium]
VSNLPLKQFLNLHHIDSTTPANATLEVVLQGVTEQLHDVSVSINGVGVGTVTFGGRDSGVLNTEIQHDLIQEGANQITLQALEGDTDVSLIDVIRLTYRHTYTADSNALRCTASGGSEVTIGGFSNELIRVVDITEPGEVEELPASISYHDSQYTVTVKPQETGDRVLLAFADDQIKAPAAIMANQPTSWHKDGKQIDLSIIAHGDLIESLEELADQRDKEGWSVGLIDVEDLYDEFSFGHNSPWALKDYFVAVTKKKKSKPAQEPAMYVLFAGDSSFDPKNYLGLGNYDLVPTKYVATDLLETASDDWFVDLDEDSLPDLAVGRLPVRTRDEADTIVGKLLAYESAISTEDWESKVLLVADENNGHDFEAMTSQVRTLIPGTMNVQTILRGQMDNTTAKTSVLDAINEGRLLVNYIGHGSVEVWRGSLLTSDDDTDMSNERRLPLFINMTCLNGHFHDLYTKSLAEALMLDEDGGAVAVWASSGLTLPDNQIGVNQELIRLLFDDESPRLGTAVMHAKKGTEDLDVRRTWILFGDPTMRLK